MNIRRILLFTLLSSLCLNAQNKIPKEKQLIIESVENHRSKLIEISDQIWALAETAFEEYKSSQLLSDFAEANGI